MIRNIAAVCLLFCGTTILYTQQTDEPVDFERARQLMQRRQSGEPLTGEDRAYLERAIKERRKQQAPSERQRPVPRVLTPLTDMTAKDRHEGEDGGLYGGGRNSPTGTHLEALKSELARIRPLNPSGDPDGNGVVGFIAISMSNATQEFSRFKQVADRSPLKSPRVLIVDCAQGGQAMAEWAPADGRPWEEARRRLDAAGLSPVQVQVAWVKLANKAPVGSFEVHCGKLERDTLAVLQNARARFPNLRVVYLGSRTYGGYAVGNLNPEPYAYESAFAVRRLILRQAKGDAALAPGKVALLLWGPYLWADGTRGRKIDSLVWERSDFGGDGVHPSDSGRQKVADQLLTFLTADPLAKSWFTGAPAARGR